MGLARSTFYDEPEGQLVDEARLVERMREICAEWPAYGYRRVTAELRGEGRIVNHKKVMRLMKENGLTVRSRRRFVATTDSDHNGPVFPNLAENIVPTDVNQLWVADITYIAIATASFISLRSWTPGHGELSAMRSASGSMYVWRLLHYAPPSRHASRRQGASITRTEVRSMPPKIIAASLPSTASRVRWADAATHTTTPRLRAS
jgi:hypothetical protein